MPTVAPVKPGEPRRRRACRAALGLVRALSYVLEGVVWRRAALVSARSDGFCLFASRAVAGRRRLQNKTEECGDAPFTAFFPKKHTQPRNKDKNVPGPAPVRAGRGPPPAHLGCRARRRARTFCGVGVGERERHFFRAGARAVAPLFAPNRGERPHLPPPSRGGPVQATWGMPLACHEAACKLRQRPPPARRRREERGGRTVRRRAGDACASALFCSSP
jgi:hypothetical protein